MPQKLVLLDRDGVINRDQPQGILSMAEFDFLPGACEAIARLTKAGFAIAICTNQSAVGRGRLAEDELHAIHTMMAGCVEEAGGRIDAIYFAPDHPDHATERRKPGAGMLREALAQFGAEPAKTPMVGDTLRDLQAAQSAGCPRILVRTGHGAGVEQLGLPPAIAPVLVVDDLWAAVEHILAHY